MLKTRAIIFRATKYKESSLILDAYTEEKGLRKYIVNGVRSAKAKIPASLLQVMNLVDIIAYDRNDREINRLKEVSLAYPYQQIPFDVIRGSLGLFMAEVARKTVKEQESNPSMFRFLFDAFVFLDDTPHSLANIHLQFLLELSIHLGIMPSGEWSKNTPIFNLQDGQFQNQAPTHSQYLNAEHSALLHHLLHIERGLSHEVKIDKLHRMQLLYSILRYYSIHLENMSEIKSLEVLRAVMS